MKIKFLGAAGTVTGSSYLLTSDSGSQLLIDLGMFQGPSRIDNLNYQPLEFSTNQLAGVILTHAHLDHCGRLPILEKMGFKGNIYMTEPTAALTELSLLDTAKISHEDHPDRVLYDKIQVQSLVQKFKPIGYHQQFSIGDFQIIFKDAGHILGSVSIEVTVDGKGIVFSGDLGNTPEDLTMPTEFFDAADIVIMESTYGDRSHPAGDPQDIILSEIQEVSKTGGTLLVPAFSLERTQELLHIISHMNIDVPVFMDSPMAEKATVIYEQFHNLLNPEIAADYKSQSPFAFQGLHMVENRKASLALNETTGAKVIIAGSGMMTGGRIVDHARALLPLPTTRLLIVGYQGEGTLGRQLLSGEKIVTINDQQIKVNAHISDTQVMSSHADQPKLLNWLKHIQGVKKVFLTHGEDGPRQSLSEKIKTELNIDNVLLPVLNQEL